MLTLLKIENIALIERLEVEFGKGLNLLTGETGSGKSIIVDSLGALTGERISSDLIKEGEQSARIEGIFVVPGDKTLKGLLGEAGIEDGWSDDVELIVRRDLSLAGKNRIFVNNQLVTQTFLKKLGAYLADIHGQGEQAALFEPASHLELLDGFAKTGAERQATATAYREWLAIRSELSELKKDEAEKLQLLDILRFQVNEIASANVRPGEDDELDEEKRRLNNVEKLSALSEESYSLLYENEEATITTLDLAGRKIEELSEYEAKFGEYIDSLQTARAVIEDLAIAVRDFRNHLEFSPERLEEIENRLVEISGLKRKYGGTLETVLEHLKESQTRLENIETAEIREEELRGKLAELRASYIRAASILREKRVAAAKRFEKEIEKNLKAVALEKARFEVRLESPDTAERDGEYADRSFTAKGFDRVEFYFSANPGESPKPLAKVASGGEASRLMLILKTTSKMLSAEKAAVFDEVDVGIGGRVAQAVGLKLKELSRSQQVLCVTHQPQVASIGDRHFVVEKDISGGKTRIGVRELIDTERVEEIARMLAGEKISDAARENARDMLAAAR